MTRAPVGDHPGTGRRRPASLLTRLTVSTCAIVLTLLALEVAVRLFLPQDPDFYNSEKFLRLNPPPGQPQTLIPNTSGSFTGVPVRINSQGFRDREVTVPKPAGVYRILALGDSVTFGFGVPLDKTYAKVLEATLKVKPPPGYHTVEVINAGIPGTGLLSYLQVLRAKSPELEPDLVLVGFVLNDVADYDGTGVTGAPRPATLAERLYGAYSPVNHVLLLHSHLYLATYLAVKSALLRLGVFDMTRIYDFDFLAAEPPSDRQARAWASTLRVLSQLVDTARGLHVPLVVVVFPMEYQLDATALELYRRELHLSLDDAVLTGLPQQRLTEFAQRSGVPLIDLFPRFRQVRDGALFLRNRSVSHDWAHPSIRGHESAALEIARQLPLPAP